MKPPVFWTLWWFGILVCLTPALAFWQTRDSTYNLVATGGFSASCSQSAAYIAATSLDATHKTAIDTLICGRVTSGVFAKLDVWNMLATTNAADARVNMVTPGTHDTTLISTPTFTADRGYTGVDASTTIALDTNFNPSTAGGHYTLNAAHFSLWSNTNNFNPANSDVDMGIVDGSTPVATYISAGLSAASAGNSALAVNANAFPSGNTQTDTLGHYLITRPNATGDIGYKNAVAISGFMGKGATTAMTNLDFYVLASNTLGSGVTNGSPRQIMTFSIGGDLSGANITDLCHATNVYLTTIAGVSGGIC
jgi:hypothetical protein